MKGISREVIPYTIESTKNEEGEGLFYLNANMIDPITATHITDVLQGALSVLKKRAAAAA